MVAALLAQRGRRPGLLLADEVSLATTVLWGQVRHESLLTLLGGGLRRLDSVWFLAGGEKLVCDAEAALRTVVSPPAVFGSATLPALFDLAGAGEEMDFAVSTLLFGEALAAGWPWALALRAFAGLGRGWPCGRGRGFMPERGKHALPGSRWLSGSIASAADPDTVATLFFGPGSSTRRRASSPSTFVSRWTARAFPSGQTATSRTLWRAVTSGRS